MKSLHKFLFLFLLVISFILNGCSRQPQGTADLPRLISQTHRISVAPFSQPRVPSELITGQLPESQGKIDAIALQNLDRDLREILSVNTKRQYIFLPMEKIKKPGTPVSGQPDAFKKWLLFGETHKIDYLLVPQVLNWNERDGSEAGVTESAHVRLEFFLINVPAKTLVSRSIYEEKQVGLIDNFLTVADFVKRKGRWVTANTLAREAMLKAVKELGL